MVLHKPAGDVRVGLPLMATETVTTQVDISTLHMFSFPQQNMAGVFRFIRPGGSSDKNKSPQLCVGTSWAGGQN